MTHEDIIEALQYKWFGCKWNLSGDTYSGLQWLENVVPKPSEAEIQTVVDTMPKPEIMNLKEEILALKQAVADLKKKS